MKKEGKKEKSFEVWVFFFPKKKRKKNKNLQIAVGFLINRFQVTDFVRSLSRCPKI